MQDFLDEIFPIDHYTTLHYTTLHSLHYTTLHYTTHGPIAGRLVRSGGQGTLLPGAGLPGTAAIEECGQIQGRIG